MTKRSKTSRFGTVARIAHDASEYYRSRLYADAPREETTAEARENPLPPSCENRILLGSAEQMSALPEACVHLMVTSPPYNVRKEYDADLSLAEYLDLLGRVWRETYRVLVPGGRACINVANVGRRPYIPLSGYISQQMLALGFLMRGEIIWNKGAGAGVSLAWGSWCSASNPVLRDTHEYILVFSKGTFRRRQPPGRQSTIEREQFLEWTKSVWTFPPESARRVGHPAPFPTELPYRLIQLYTFSGEVVLDPFMGSGSTALAALKAGRRFVGYEVDAAYIALAEARLAAFRAQHGGAPNVE